ncbi:phosphotransferase [Candidatus Bathyarchaeota archaeon]|nr:phosphotransferase [Candidatus Bathyarchaeota archaeon]
MPVPEVFAYDADVSNEAGAPYMLLEYIHGTTADQLENANPSQPWSFGTVEQDRKPRDQMAKIQAEVASFTFSSIGGLYYSEDTETFYIGPDLETGKGPWASSTDYYRDLTDHLLKTTMSRCGHLTTGIPSFALPVLCNHLLGACGEETAGPFRLMNTDFGPHNILVNDGFEIVGIVDFDGMKAAPLEAAAQYPRFSHMTVFPPGYIEAHPLQGPRIEEQKHLLAEYKDCLTRHEVEIRGGDGPAVVGPRLGSTGAIAYDGLLNYGRLARNVNERWFASALLMLKDYAKGLQ